jgi:hypothetical protein
MTTQELPEGTIDRIRTAGPEKTDSALARELGIHRNTVRKYRAPARIERQEVAREILAQHVAENIPDALKDLTDLRKRVREKYEEKGDPRDGQLWLAAIKTTLEHVRPDDAYLDDAIEAEMERVAASRQGASPSQAQAACPPAVH